MASNAARGAAVFIAIIAVLLSFGAWWVHRSIPPLTGSVTLSGLSAPVNVRFDKFAIPHVLARSDDDAWRAVGYLQGRDRLWQMELYRRAASGRLSELLGDATVAIDQRFLTLDLRGAAEIEWQRTPPRVRAAFQNYAAGVNAAMAVSRGKLPLEYQLLGLHPEPWTPVDSLAVGKLFAWRLGENHRAELLRYELAQKLDVRAAFELFPTPPDWAPTILEAPGREEGIGQRAERAGAPPTADLRPSAGGSSLASIQHPRGLEWLSSDSGAMSNSWVVHGSRTASGRPILANDPHLMIEMPSVWWEVHVESDTVNVAGVTIPGIPFIIIGHNARIGWGLTNVGADVQDLFRESLNATRQAYLSGNRQMPLEIRRHEIRVRGRADPIRFDVRSTPNGPLMNVSDWRDLQPGDPARSSRLDEVVLALKWDAVVQGQSAAAFEALARAGNWPEFVSAVRQFSAPAQNFVYADVDGNIGYAMSGLLPRRSEGHGTFPMPAGSGSAWRGSVDIDELPAVLNPPSGQFVTANNEIDRQLSFTVTSDWVAPFRAQRIIALLGDGHRHDLDTMVKIQGDITSTGADWILNHVETPAEVGELRTWDRRMDDRPMTALYHAFERALWRRTFADEMGPPLYDRFYRYAANERFAGLHAVIADADSPWFDDRATVNVIEKRADIARQAATDAATSLKDRYGDRANWRWSEMHAVRFSHALSGGGRLLEWFFSRGPVPVMGDSRTVNKTTTNLRRPYETSEAASYRQILDVGAWDGSVAINTTGQSGHPRSPHYFDQNALWRQGLYRQLPFTHAAVEAATVTRLALTPGP
jgi:penicillin amidase